MRLVYKDGCTSYELTIDGKETADMTQQELADCIVSLLRNGYLPDAADLQSLLENIVESNGTLTAKGYCEQCGDNYYTYELNIPEL